MSIWEVNTHVTSNTWPPSRRHHSRSEAGVTLSKAPDPHWTITFGHISQLMWSVNINKCVHHLKRLELCQYNGRLFYFEAIFLLYSGTSVDKSFCFSSPGNLQMGFGRCRFDHQRWVTVLYVCILYYSMCVMGLFWHIQNRGKDKKGTSGQILVTPAGNRRLVLFFRSDVAVGLCGFRWLCARRHTHHCPPEGPAHGKKDPPLLCGPVLMPLFTRYYFNWLNK